MLNRVSALDGHFQQGHFGLDGKTGVVLKLNRHLVLHQVAAWPNTIDQVGGKLASHCATDGYPGPCQSLSSGNVSLLRIEPLKWWLVGTDAPILEAEQGSCLDISHSRTCVNIEGPQSVELLNRLLPIDFRDSEFPVGSVGSSSMHHIGVTFWRNQAGYGLFMPRGFALSGWEVILASAKQFGVDVIDSNDETRS